MFTLTLPGLSRVELSNPAGPLSALGVYPVYLVDPEGMLLPERYGVAVRIGKHKGNSGGELVMIGVVQGGTACGVFGAWVGLP